MASAPITEKTVRILGFDGHQENWYMWSRKFLAYARMKGYVDVVLGTVQVDKASVDLSHTQNPIIANKLKIRARNAEAYNALVMAIEETDAFYCVEDACKDG